MSDPHIWTQRDGTEIEVRWMTSIHLVHSFNMILRKQGWGESEALRYFAANKNDMFCAMFVELKRRQYMKWMFDNNAGLINTRGVPRETPKQLAMLRAVLDSASSTATISLDFRKDPQAFIDKVMTRPHSPEAIKFVEYRLAHP